MNTETCLGVTFNKKSYKKVTLDIISLFIALLINLIIEKPLNSEYINIIMNAVFIYSTKKV